MPQVGHRLPGCGVAGADGAMAGAAGYVVSGLRVEGLPQASFGFVYLPALLGISLCSVLVAGLGARAAHALPVASLKKSFAVLLLGMALKMLIGLI